jgi:23S rRNA pseudouridine1911/1915/1917 synthase
MKFSSEEIFKEFKVNKKNAAKRIDTYLREFLVNKYSRNFIQNVIKQGKVKANGKPVNSNYRLKENDSIVIEIPERIEFKAVGQDIPVEVIYEDEQIIVVNKPAGMVVHPAFGNYTGTLVNALLYRYPELPKPLRENEKDPFDSGRLGIVHRLDKDTSGVMVITRNQQAMAKVAAQFHNRQVKKTYKAIVAGIMKKEEGSIDAPIGRNALDRKKMAVNIVGGKQARTLYRRIKVVGPCTLVEAYPKTGRMHQIRIHMKHIGFPVLGDREYWSGNITVAVPRQMLHACSITFLHPATGKEVSFSAPLPDDFKRVLRELKKLKGYNDRQ